MIIIGTIIFTGIFFIRICMFFIDYCYGILSFIFNREFRRNYLHGVLREIIILKVGRFINHL